MDISHERPDTNNPVTSIGAQNNINKRLFTSPQDEPPGKKARAAVEEPALYSDAVRKKLASTSRTGQACDRCKERKMKCDTNPIACQPCRQKNLRCYTTDRVTGQPRERGQTDRAENELSILREQHAIYMQRYGPLQPRDHQNNARSPSPVNANEQSQQVQPSLERDKNKGAEAVGIIPDSQYIGWPAPSHTEPLHSGPVNGTIVDILDGTIDIADFPCEAMDEYPMHNYNVFNMSRTSVMNTIAGYQNVTDPRFPSKEHALRDAEAFLSILAQFVPIVHKSSFSQMVHRIYDQPDLVSQSERVQLAVVLGIVEQQTGLRNSREAAEKSEQSHHHIHYALTYYRELLRENTLASMQALALILVHFRNLPKPAYTWGFAHNLLVKAMDAQYHRDPDKIQLPPSEDNLLTKELRKRVFHSILGICVTTGCRVGRPAPWQFGHMDVPLPLPIKDSEISETGLVTPLSGSCDFWPCIHLAKLLPLLTEMYNYVTSVRRSEREYVRTVEILHSKINAWRRDWDESIRGEAKTISLTVATLLVEGWAAEYSLNLYHPSLCPTRSTDIMDRHLDICHKQAQRLLKSFHILSGKYKGVDFTWHSTVAYACGFGVTLNMYHNTKARMSSANYDAMKNELSGWLSVMAYADLVLRTGKYLTRIFEPRVRRLEAECQDMMRSTPTEHIQHQPSTIPTSSTLPNRSYIKPDPSPRPSSLNLVPTNMDMRTNQGQQDIATHYSQNQTPPSTQQWTHAAQYVPHTGALAPRYATFATNSQYSGLPTSLAPLLNDQSGGYITYPPTTNPTTEMMFQPAHYSDGLMWPFINMPHQ